MCPAGVSCTSLDQMADLSEFTQNSRCKRSEGVNECLRRNESPNTKGRSSFLATLRPFGSAQGMLRSPLPSVGDFAGQALRLCVRLSRSASNPEDPLFANQTVDNTRAPAEDGARRDGCDFNVTAWMGTQAKPEVIRAMGRKPIALIFSPSARPADMPQGTVKFTTPKPLAFTVTDCCLL